MSELVDDPWFEVGHTPPAKVYGVGEFGVDSFDVFCRGDLDVAPADKTLQSFVAWQKRHAVASAK